MSWFGRLRNVLRRSRIDREVQEEIAFHLDERARELREAGMPDAEARNEARRRFGNPQRARESSRDVKLLPSAEAVMMDLSFGLRLLRHNKTVAAAAILSLSLAIGACTAAFSLIDALILRPLPVADPASVVNVGYRTPGDAQDALSFNYPLFAEMRDASAPHITLFAMSDLRLGRATVDGAAESEPIYAQWMSGSAFAILGIDPAIGRLLQPDDDLRPGQHPVAVLSHAYWMRRFGGRSDVLGRWVTVRERPLQIVGVAEQTFTGLEPGSMPDLWAPMMMWDPAAITDRSTRWFRVWGRLAPGVSADQSRAAMQPVFTNFRRDEAVVRLAGEPRDRVERFLNTQVVVRRAGSGASNLRQDFQQSLWVLGGVAAMVLLIACANVAGLLTARGEARRREMALRMSIGAGRGRLIQQMLAESAWLSLASCLGGALIAAAAAPRAVAMLATSRSAVRLDVDLDWRVLLFLAVIGGLVTALFGLPPAVRASAVSPQDALRSGGGKQTSRNRTFRPLVAAQVAFGFVVLFVAGLCLASFGRLINTDVGFDPDSVTLAMVESKEFREGGPAALAAWYRLVQDLAAVPGVESASLSRIGLFEGPGRNKAVRIPGREPDGSDPWYLGVSPGFFETMRISLVEGRDIDWRDAEAATPTAVVVNQSFARKYFPGESAVGKRFFRVDRGDTGTTLAPQHIVGIARDATYRTIRQGVPPTVYDPYRAEGIGVLQIRSPLPTSTLAPALRAALPRAHPSFELVELTTQSTLIANTLVRDRALALLSGAFSMVAFALVIVGLYGVLSYGVVQRSREIGIRLALGARALSVVRLVVADTAVVAAIGLIVGGACAVGAARLVGALLYEVSPTDVGAIAAPIAALAIAGVLSALPPALRAIKVDPAVTLRQE